MTLQCKFMSLSPISRNKLSIWLRSLCTPVYPYNYCTVIKFGNDHFYEFLPFLNPLLKKFSNLPKVEIVIQWTSKYTSPTANILHIYFIYTYIYIIYIYTMIFSWTIWKWQASRHFILQHFRRCLLRTRTFSYIYHNSFRTPKNSSIN